MDPSPRVPAKAGTHSSEAREAEPWASAFAGTTDFRAEKLSPALGARISGIDLARPLSAGDKDAIWRAFLEHHVLVFPGQSLSREAQFAFAANFGEVEGPEASRANGKRHDVAHVMSNLDAAGNPTVRYSPAANYHWHTDKPYHPAPPMLTTLYAVEVPSAGGDTEFANTALGYEVLQNQTRRRIAGRRVIFRPAFDRDLPAVDHPLVRTHPDTGRQALYLGNHSTGILGMSADEGRALLGELIEHTTQPQFRYRHSWRAGDLVMWDNRCLLHRAVLDDNAGKYRRVMHRSLVKGSVPE